MMIDENKTLEVLKSVLGKAVDQTIPEAKIRLLDELSIPVGNAQREEGRATESANAQWKRVADGEAKEKATDERQKQKDKIEADTDKRIAAKQQREAELDKHIAELEAAAARYDSAHSAIQKARGAA